MKRAEDAAGDEENSPSNVERHIVVVRSFIDVPCKRFHRQLLGVYHFAGQKSNWKRSTVSVSGAYIHKSHYVMQYIHNICGIPVTIYFTQGGSRLDGSWTSQMYRLLPTLTFPLQSDIF